MVRIPLRERITRSHCQHDLGELASVLCEDWPPSRGGWHKGVDVFALQPFDEQRWPK